jgi:hypothetical protein
MHKRSSVDLPRPAADPEQPHRTLPGKPSGTRAEQLGESETGVTELSLSQTSAWQLCWIDFKGKK